jgi:hypothetical protein
MLKDRARQNRVEAGYINRSQQCAVLSLPEFALPTHITDEEVETQRSSIPVHSQMGCMEKRHGPKCHAVSCCAVCPGLLGLAATWQLG